MTTLKRQRRCLCFLDLCREAWDVIRKPYKQCSAVRNMLEILTIVGALLGITAFVWNIRDLFMSYLHIDLEISQSQGNVFAKATVENKSQLKKKIDNALFLVGPESESPEETFNRVSKENAWNINATCTNDIAEHHVEVRAMASKGRQIVPLSFFYSENRSIADERLSYCAPLSLESIEAGVPYSVRFFVFDKTRLHRSTHSCFQL